MKLGLALSGGGLRAALFHVGVLAQLAQMGLLRPVEVLSTVSGGSIIGALYYLKVKVLLERKHDQEITDHDYLQIVSDIEETFLRVVQRNLRIRTFLNPLIYFWRNLPGMFSADNRRMAFKHGGLFSRTDRLGELWDQHLYRPALGFARPVTMRDLKITTRDGSSKGALDNQNQTRSAKIPTLLINATVLNSGHNWRFDSLTMGEPDRGIAVLDDIDRNFRLSRPSSYEAMPSRFCEFSLGRAVAASTAVPGLFPPVSIYGLYPENIWVELVDGGVHDNQGLQGLMDLGCTHCILSDGSRQLEDDSDPPVHAGTVLNRTSSILADRLREEQLLRLLKGDGTPVALIHLRKGLPSRHIPWIGKDGRPAILPSLAESSSNSSGLGICQEVQELLTRVRTDLDSFTEVEAYSLMLGGYRITEGELGALRKTGSLGNECVNLSHLWTFLNIEPFAISPTKDYIRQLHAAQHRFFKIFRLSWSISLFTFLFVGLPFLIVALAFAVLLFNEIEEVKFTAGEVFEIVALVIACIGAIVLSLFGLRTRRFTWFARFFARPPDTGAGTMFIWPFVWLHLVFFDRLFLRRGQLSRLQSLRKNGGDK